MSYPLTVEEQIAVGRVSMVLSRKDIHKAEFQQGIPYFEQLLPLLIAMETDCLAWQYDINPGNTNLFQQGNYLYGLCGRWAIKALATLNAGGQVIVPTEPSGTIINIAGQIVQLVVGDASQANPAGSPTPADGDTVVTLNYKVMPNSETIFYAGVEVQLYPSSDFWYIPNYGATTTTYTFKDALSAGFNLKFDFMKIIGTSSGSGTASGLQAVTFIVSTSGSTITVGELGTFVSLTYNGQSYNKKDVTQTGQDLDLSKIGSDFMGEEITVMYYP